MFTPTLLTILGVIMYLRLGWVVGNAGLYGALAVIMISNVITLITALSMSSLATNMRVGVGGAYYLISRSFGLEVGGAIGIPLYLSQVLSVTLYSYGLAESLGFSGTAVMPVAALIVVLVSIVAGRSTELALKAQIPLMLLIFASIVSLLMGVEWSGSKVPNVGTFEQASPMLTFAVFFPAVTGILTGLSLSGDLADPSSAIPRGGLAAVAVGAVVYLALPFALVNGASSDALLNNPRVWTEVAAISWLVLPGMWGAILSSAFGAILSAPRTLQALSGDRLAPSRFGEVDEASGEPILGLYVSAAIALAACGLGSLDAVAKVVTMFFLTTYGALNLVACAEAIIGDPSFRPRIRIPWWVAGTGAVGCFVAMFAISPAASFAAVFIEFVIFVALSRRTLEATWGDARSGLLLTAARTALMRLRDATIEPRNWRPHIIVLTPDLERDIPVVRMANELAQHRGILTVCQLVAGNESMHTRAEELEVRNRRLLQKSEIWDVFSEVSLVGDFDLGAVTVAQANGIAGLHSNTASLGYHDDGPEQLGRLFALVRRMDRIQKSSLIVRPKPVSNGQEGKKVIMIWWAGRENNGDLMLLLGHLLTTTAEWMDARIVLKSVVEDAEAKKERWNEFSNMGDDIRIDVSFDIMLRGNSEIRDIIGEHSRRASLVMLGMHVPDVGEELEYAKRIQQLLDVLPNTILVRNSGPFRGRLL